MHKRFKPFNLMLSFLLAGLPLSACQGEPTERTLKIKIEKTWTVDMAREEAFRDALPSLDLDPFPQIDPNFVVNRLRKGSWQDSRWYVTTFDDGSYSVAAMCAHESLTYNSQGILESVIVSNVPTYGHPVKCPQQFPATSRTYTAISYQGYPKGSLLSVSITPKLGDTYTFDTDQKLRTHYIEDSCYNADGTFCGERSGYYSQ